MTETNPAATVSGGDSLAHLREHIRQFVHERDWEQFHAPKNLAVSVAIEAAELLELFQWQDEDASYRLTADQREQVRQEIGDVLITLIQLADKFDLDPVQCAWDKMRINAAHYPAERARGSAQKYTAYRNDQD